MAQVSQSVESRRYEVEDAVRTLSRADQIKRDPKMMADVKRHAATLVKIVATPKSRPRGK